MEGFGWMLIELASWMIEGSPGGDEGLLNAKRFPCNDGGEDGDRSLEVRFPYKMCFNVLPSTVNWGLLRNLDSVVDPFLAFRRDPYLPRSVLYKYCSSLRPTCSRPLSNTRKA